MCNPSSDDARRCDKCGHHVPQFNDAAHFDAILSEDLRILQFGVPRHLLPVVENGKVICEGSPSRAQYLEGQPRDPRPGFHYRPELEQRFRDVYNRMQKEIAGIMK